MASLARGLGSWAEKEQDVVVDGPNQQCSRTGAQLRDSALIFSMTFLLHQQALIGETSIGGTDSSNCLSLQSQVCALLLNGWKGAVSYLGKTSGKKQTGLFIFQIPWYDCT